jgi:hypothetical protein
MKWPTLSILIGIWVTGMVLFSVFPAGAEEGKRLPDSVKPVQSERDLGPNRSAPVESKEPKEDADLDETLQFEATRRETTPPEREAETLRFHQSTVLERFENADAHGQLVFSFSTEGIELRLRSITGAEAPVVSMNRSLEE